MKIVRLGNTESHLLLISYILKHGNEPNYIKKQLSSIFLNYVNWVYTTAGYYDKSVNGNKFNFKNDAININFINFIKHLQTSIGNCAKAQFYLGDNMVQLLNKYKNGFFNEYNIKNFELMNGSHFYDRIQGIFNLIENKKVLVISSFDGLVLSQYNSGNIYKIYDKFPKIKHLKTVKSPYCFLNNGPHNNYHETLETLFNEIKNIDFDIALLGCGCYGHMLCHKIDNELNKDAVYLGGSIQTFFGILSSREKTTCSRTGKKKKNNIAYNKYWITEIPESYRPPNYLDIENGCYW